MGKKGRQPSLLTVTEKGAKAIGERLPKTKGKGGPIHQFWQFTIQRNVKGKDSIKKAVIEQHRKGKNVDVGILLGDGINIAIEITLNQKNLVENVVKDLEVGYDKVIVATEKKTEEKKAKEKLSRELDLSQLEKVEFRLLSTFLS